MHPGDVPEASECAFCGKMIPKDTTFYREWVDEGIHDDYHPVCWERKAQEVR